MAMNVTQTVLELPASVRWLTPGVTSLADYQGRPLVMAFVNPASDWCQQRLLDLERWQRRNPGLIQMLVVAVPRFGFERDPARCLALLRRAGYAGDVVLDSRWAAWSACGITQWPTVLLIDVAGREVSRIVGGGPGLEQELARLCHDIQAQTVARPVGMPPRGLSAPMGMAADGERLYIADSGHHRVLECAADGRVLRRFGMGLPDLLDGQGEEAAFQRPRALVLDRTSLYVADTGNHAIRRINLLSGQVDTLLGNGQQGDLVEGTVASSMECRLSQPTALALADNQLLIAQSGDNRIWSLELGTRQLRVCAGSGALELRDGGPLLGAFAQPVALLSVQKSLYVCDALSSSLRSVQVRDGVVQTLLGQGMARFGHADGERAGALLHFPQAMAMAADSPWLWIADAGNGVLRRLRLGGGELTTVPLPRDLPGMAGLAVVDDTVWIADTDGNAVLRYDPASGILTDVPIGE